VSGAAAVRGGATYDHDHDHDDEEEEARDALLGAGEASGPAQQPPPHAGSSSSSYGDFVRGTTDWLALNETLRKNGLPTLSFISRPAQSRTPPSPPSLLLPPP
jgi:hypothetical protein